MKEEASSLAEMISFWQVHCTCTCNWEGPWGYEMVLQISNNMRATCTIKMNCSLWGQNFTLWLPKSSVHIQENAQYGEVAQVGNAYSCPETVKVWPFERKLHHGKLVESFMLPAAKQAWSCFAQLTMSVEPKAVIRYISWMSKIAWIEKLFLLSLEGFY